jgi:hypothetical protein
MRELESHLRLYPFEQFPLRGGQRNFSEHITLFVNETRRGNFIPAVLVFRPSRMVFFIMYLFPEILTIEKEKEGGMPNFLSALPLFSSPSSLLSQPRTYPPFISAISLFCRPHSSTGMGKYIIASSHQRVISRIDCCRKKPYDARISQPMFLISLLAYRTH